MSGARGAGRRSLWQVFRWPTLLALLTCVGLLSALLGDGLWDALGWLALVVPLAWCVHGLLQATRRG